MTKHLLRAGAVLALTLVGLAACSAADDTTAASGGQSRSADPSMAATEATYPPGVSPDVVSNSNNGENPPPRDITGVECVASGPTGPSARGTLTNHSGGLSNYMIGVNWTDQAGTVVASQTGFANNIPGGADATWEVPSFAMDVTAAGCQVVSVERMGV